MSPRANTRLTGEGMVEFVRHLIDDDGGIDTQFKVADIDGDSRPDIASANKKGVHISLQTP